jgi:transcriptional regulator with XRE-family HTH domain
MDRSGFGKYLTSRRNKTGFSLIKMAQKAGLSPSMLNQMELGGISKPSYDTLLKVCKAYDVDENEARRVFFQETPISDTKSRKVDILNEPEELMNLLNSFLTEIDRNLSPKKKKDLINKFIKERVDSKKTGAADVIKHSKRSA